MMLTEPQSPAQVRAEVARLVDEQRSRCLWFLRPDYYPESDEEIERTLRAIERSGDQNAFRCARKLRQWLFPISSVKSAGA